MARQHVQGGRYYQRTKGGPLVPSAPDGRLPDVVVCRRVRDYPAGQLPVGGQVAMCTTCDEAVLFDPRGPHQDRPRQCMQCAGLEPLPIPAPHPSTRSA